MSEYRQHGPESQETSMISSSWKSIVRTTDRLRNFAQESFSTGQELWKQDDVRTGGEAAFRSVLNIAISCVDVVPGAGELASWGADALKVLEEIRHRQKQKEALARGEDPRKVPREKYNLTPDVHVLVATLTEALEFVTFFTFPTHAIETTGQLWYDVPRMYRGIKQARKTLGDIRARRERAREAAKHFRTVVDERKK